MMRVSRVVIASDVDAGNDGPFFVTNGEREPAAFKPDFIATKTMKVKVTKFLNYLAYQGHRNVYEWIVLTLTSATVTLAIINTMDNCGKHWFRFTIISLEATFLGCILVEYVLRAWSSTGSATYRQSWGLLRYLVTRNMIVDAFIIMSSCTTIVCWITSHENSRITCLLQLIRLLRLDRKQGALQMLSESFKNHRQELVTCWYVGFLIVAFLSFLVYALESENTGSTADNLLNSIYWGMMSLTCIGYGDLAPSSAASKVLTCSFAFFGACFLALPAGIIGSGFAIQVAKQHKQKHVRKRRRPAAIVIQSFWRKFAADRNLPATWLPHVRAREEKDERKYSLTERLFNRVSPCVSPKPRGGSLRLVKKEYQLQENDNGLITNEVRLTRSLSSARQFEPSQGASSLTGSEKIALRFTRLLKCIVAVKNFRQARRPYDERDILDPLASSQIEMAGELQDIGKQMEVFYDESDRRISDIEQRMKLLDSKVSLLISEVELQNKLFRLYVDSTLPSM